jgi:protein O-GlcNAc transferase
MTAVRGWMAAGRQALARGDHARAIAAFEQAADNNPDHAGVFLALGRARILSGAPGAAAEAFARASELEPGNAEAWRALAEALRFVDRLDEALEAIGRAVVLAPDDGRVLAQQVFVAQRACAWDGLEAARSRLAAVTVAAINAGRPSPMRPFMAATCFDDPALAHAVARSESMVQARRAGTVEAPPWRHRNGPLTIGYLSAGFGAHPTGHLLRGLFGHHDRERFRIVGLALNRDDGSQFRRDIAAGCDAFIPLAGRDNRAAAAAIGAAGVDILIDLHGWLQNHRMAIMARRAAPVQVSWLGFPGTTGAPFIDWLIGDPVVSPPSDQRHFTERLVRLPETYQANDPHPQVGAPTSRVEQGLPEDAVVMACFNVSYKIDPASFALFCEVLQRTPQAVLWLLETNPTARANLIAAATRAGIDPARLVFAPFAAKHDHLSRLGLADLALDTGICNGHTTTTDALWAGVPVVARRGRHFASRVAASLLGAAGLGDLVADDESAWVALAGTLAGDAGRRRACRRHLLEGRDSLALFDTARLARHLEAAFLAMAGLARAGIPAQPIDVAPVRGPYRKDATKRL